jgi:hypothetical protein
VQELASAIRLDRNLENLYIQMEDGFTDEAGVALAEALTVNKTLRKLHLSVQPVFPDAVGVSLPNPDAVGAPAYEAFGAMLRSNASLHLELPRFRSAGVDPRLIDSLIELCKQINIEQRLKDVGRGRLLSSSSQTTREEWVDALHELSSFDANDSPSFNVSGLYSLLRLNPAICMLKVDATCESCD